MAQAVPQAPPDIMFREHRPVHLHDGQDLVRVVLQELRIGPPELCRAQRHARDLREPGNLRLVQAHPGYGFLYRRPAPRAGALRIPCHVQGGLRIEPVIEPGPGRANTTRDPAQGILQPSFIHRHHHVEFVARREHTGGQNLPVHALAAQQVHALMPPSGRGHDCRGKAELPARQRTFRRHRDLARTAFVSLPTGHPQAQRAVRPRSQNFRRIPAPDPRPLRSHR